MGGDLLKEPQSICQMSPLLVDYRVLNRTLRELERLICSLGARLLKPGRYMLRAPLAELAP